MSDFRALATVTAVLRDILSDVQTDVGNISIKALSPDQLSKVTEDTLNVYLYQVTPNSAYRNVDLPTRSQDGKTITAKPQLAVDLHYLLTAYTIHNDELKAQEMLASAMIILHDNEIIARSKIATTIQNPNHNKDNDIVAGSNLADQPESIKLIPQAMSLEELTKLWTVFFQTSYRISTAYQASVVLLESKLKPKPSLPVSKRLLRVFPIKQPIIDTVTPQTLEYDANAQLTINGKNLMGDKVIVLIDNQEVPITQKANLSENQITSSLPATVSAGVKQVQVEQLFLFDSNDTGHSGYVSNVSAFVLAPKINSLTKQLKVGEILTVQFSPGLIKDQTVNVLVGDYVLPVDLPTDPASYPIAAVSVKIPTSVKPGAYMVRLRVDGADSQPPQDDSQTIQINP